MDLVHQFRHESLMVAVQMGLLDDNFLVQINVSGEGGWWGEWWESSGHWVPCKIWRAMTDLRWSKQMRLVVVDKEDFVLCFEVSLPRPKLMSWQYNILCTQMSPIDSNPCTFECEGRRERKREREREKTLMCVWNVFCVCLKWCSFVCVFWVF
jgi:hypothetical protein